MATPTDREKVEAKRRSVVGAMVSSVQHGEPREYQVGVVGYYIEGVPYSATGLSVNQYTPPDIVLTDESFTCTAFFQPHMLDPGIVVANGIIQKYLGDQAIDLVPVRLEVKLIDIWAVAEFIKGEQHDLFLDPETAQSRLMSFPPEPD
jgi:hypothetical protein